MKILGLDIGTTTVSAVVVESGSVLSSVTLNNDSFLPSPNGWEKIQDPGRIRETALRAVDALLAEHEDVARIGVTGQMHGIVYLDAQGNPVSPLYTWQDGRGDLPFGETGTYVSRLSGLTGYPLSTGYGLVTHYYNEKNRLVPKNAAVFCTIHDYIAMILAGRCTPVTEQSDAASFGLFHGKEGRFDLDAMAKAGLDTALLPALAEKGPIGSYRGIPVYPAIGDNQASFLGATGGRRAALANVGTGSQISVFTETYMDCPGLETRPFPGGGYLLVGASLCGGRAYAMLERFFRMTGQLLGLDCEDAYEAMNTLLRSSEKPCGLPVVRPLFQGTRQDPALRGSITGLSTENFTPLHLLWGMMQGMAEELHGMYESYLAMGGEPVPLIGSGNGLRKNPHLQQCFREVFGQSLTMSDCREEAATGAAIYAGTL